MNMALFGGSFDPPHLGHDSIVKMALESLKIDKLIIMPTYISPFKSNFSAPPALRLDWVRKIWGNLNKVQISDFEIAQNRPVPTIQSVLRLYEIYEIKKLYILIGADHLNSLHKWHEFDKLCKLAHFVIAERDHIAIPKELEKMNIHVDISSSKIRAGLSDTQIPPAIKDEVIKFYKGIKMQNDFQKRIENIVKILDEKKAEEIEVFDMQDRDYFVKFVIIATTMGERHAYSLTDDLKEGLKPLGEQFLGIESSPDWVVLDLGDMLIHLLSPQYRAKYNIEEFLNKLKVERE
ncbi:MAG: nicotinate (nicotinamide) nucleotide adenylyltransferase [Campylobacter sp.]|nr:nicotinate (nicotinamide) nucleotide adenylyltransferase [Campylobacter sp.]